MEDGDRSSAASRRPRWSIVAAVAAVLAAHFALANGAAWNKCGTFDESSHIANGYSCWVSGDYRMYPVAILQHRWITLPLLFRGYHEPPLDAELWTRSDNWEYGRQLLYRLGNDSQEILHLARMMTSLWSVVLGGLVFVWARQLFGTASGFVALLLYAFNPNVLAHASSATIDLPAALAFTAALWTLWRTLERLTPGRLAASCVVWGLALTSKFSALLLVPMALLLLAVRWLDGRPWPYAYFGRSGEIDRRMRMLPRFAFLTAAHACAVWLTIWAMFGFRFEMYVDRVVPIDAARYPQITFDGAAAECLKPRADRPNDPQHARRFVVGTLRFFRDYRLFPEAYLYCFLNTLQTVSGFSAYLDGRHCNTGFASFFPLCTLYKTPGATFVLALLALAHHVVRRRRQMAAGESPLRLLAAGMYAVAPLWVLILVYSWSAITGNINIGIRHILPVFPAAFILIGVAGRWLTDAWEVGRKPTRRGRDHGPTHDVGRSTFSGAIARWTVVGCLAWQVVAVVNAYPNYLAYFNLIAGGPKNGYKHLVDSSLDWGQELPALKKWLDTNVSGQSPKPRVYFSYFGSTPPDVFGIDAVLLPGFWDRQQLDPKIQAPFEPELSPGLYCISATMLQSVYNQAAGGPWLTTHEQAYQQVLRNIVALYSAPPADRQRLIDQHGMQTWLGQFYVFEHLRLARLCNYLRRREPIAHINYGILIFNVSQADLDSALRGPPASTSEPPKTPGGETRY